MARRADVQDATGRSEYNPGYGQMRRWGSGAPVNGQQGDAPGCIYQNLTGGPGSSFYVNIGTFASNLWINIDQPDGNLVALAGTTTITALTHAGRTLLLSLAGGFTSTLPAATGSGLIYRFMVGIVSTTGYVIAAAGSDVFKGSVEIDLSASAGSTERFVSTANQTITLNGTTKGGVAIGDWIQLQDILAGVWSVTGLLVGSGTLATPFS